MDLETAIDIIGKYRNISLINEAGESRIGLGVTANAPGANFQYSWRRGQDLKKLLILVADEIDKSYTKAV